MRKNLIFSLLLTTTILLSNSVFAQIDSNNKKIIDSPLTIPTTFPNIDRTLYDEDGFALKQPNLPKDIVISDADVDTNNIQNITSLDAKDVKHGELAACFDYYSFGSVNVSLVTDKSTYTPGGLPVVINGDIKNNNK